MKSGKQRGAEIRVKRQQRAAKRKTAAQTAERRLRPELGAPVNDALLAPYNSYGAPDFAMRGYYVDLEFRCQDCGKEEIWTATQQKWWYEVAKGYPYSTAVRCRACRRKERARRDGARRVHLAGLERKKQLRR